MPSHCAITHALVLLFRAPLRCPPSSSAPQPLPNPASNRPASHCPRRFEPRVGALPLGIPLRRERGESRLGFARPGLGGLRRRPRLRCLPPRRAKRRRVLFARLLQRADHRLFFCQPPPQPLCLRHVFLLQPHVRCQLLHQPTLRRMRLLQLRAQPRLLLVERRALRLPPLPLLASLAHHRGELPLRRRQLCVHRRAHLRRALRLDLLHLPHPHRLVGERVRPALARRARTQRAQPADVPRVHLGP
mmetsp:Transcript_14571/g.36409  ORF Transcript_14571/g.36409 Transcript_14571/m.36409 type:complete len:246 (-) Transcript_14571:665-1402(-)